MSNNVHLLQLNTVGFVTMITIFVSWKQSKFHSYLTIIDNHSLVYRSTRSSNIVHHRAANNHQTSTTSQRSTWRRFQHQRLPFSDIVASAVTVRLRIYIPGQVCEMQERQKLLFVLYTDTLRNLEEVREEERCSENTERGKNQKPISNVQKKKT